MATERHFRYEHGSEPVLSPAAFSARMRGHLLIAGAILGAALLPGVAGYHLLEHMSWVDALLNASMILGGMGPVDTLHTVAGKLFASFYAIFSGVVFIAVAGIIIAPLAHRILHRLHVESPRGD